MNKGKTVEITYSEDRADCQVREWHVVVSGADETDNAKVCVRVGFLLAS